MLRGRYRGDRPDGPKRAERLLVAQRVSPLLPDERDQSLACHRHPAERPVWQRQRDVRGSDSGASARGGSRSVVHVVSLVLYLPPPPSLHGSFPRPPLLPA